MISTWEILEIDEDSTITEIRSKIVEKISELLFSTDIFTDQSSSDLFLKYFNSYISVMEEKGEVDSHYTMSDYPPYMIETIFLGRAIKESLDGKHEESLKYLTCLDSKYSIFKGVIKLRGKLLEEAEKELVSSAKRDGSNPEAWFWLGELYLKEDKKRKALYMYETARMLLPEDPLLKKRILQLKEFFDQKEGGSVLDRTLKKIKKLFRFD